jgi:hypothetical protein
MFTAEFFHMVQHSIAATVASGSFSRPIKVVWIQPIWFWGVRIALFIFIPSLLRARLDGIVATIAQSDIHIPQFSKNSLSLLNFVASLLIR